MESSIFEERNAKICTRGRFVTWLVQVSVRAQNSSVPIAGQATSKEPILHFKVHRVCSSHVSPLSNHETRAHRPHCEIKSHLLTATVFGLATSTSWTLFACLLWLALVLVPHLARGAFPALSPPSHIIKIKRLDKAAPL